MIICDSIQYVDELSQDLGFGCSHFDFFSQLDRVVTTQAISDLLMAQWSIYLVILIYSWVRYVIKKTKI